MFDLVVDNFFGIGISTHGTKMVPYLQNLFHIDSFSNVCNNIEAVTLVRINLLWDSKLRWVKTIADGSFWYKDGLNNSLKMINIKISP